MKEGGDGGAAARLKNRIEIRDLRIAFGNLDVLRGIDLDIRCGETLCVLGGSGCGKSVLLKCVAGLLRPDAGSIKVDGEEIVGLDEKTLVEVRKRIGFVFQNSALFDSLPVYENVAYPVREHRKVREAELDKIVADRLALVGLEGVQDKYPAELSGGMRKRVALARAVAADPAIVLYDEPTTGLDPTNARRIDLLIRELQRRLGVTGIVVTHDISSAFTVADRLALMADGVIRAQGTPDEFRKSHEPLVREFLQARPVPTEDFREPRADL